MDDQGRSIGDYEGVSGREQKIYTRNGASIRSCKLQLLDLPGEILSLITSYLTLPEIISFLSLHPTLLSLTHSHLSPIRQSIHTILSSSQPYPTILAKLPSLSLFIPPDDGTIFIPVLVRARPRWIVERLEIGRWPESTWKEAFQRRFLPSWSRYKVEGDTWRAVFLRMLGRLEHRYGGCTHEESWTRFVTLHRNGSASINRIYTRQFDPYQIYDELKHQSNFSSEPTMVRVVVHLQDVRIIALGVLSAHPSMFVNRNAHAVLHPPLLRALDGPAQDNENEGWHGGSHDVNMAHNDHDVLSSTQPVQPLAAEETSNTHNSLIRTTTSALTFASPPDPHTSEQPPHSPTNTRRATLTSLLGRRRRSSGGKSDDAQSAPAPPASTAASSSSTSTVSRLGAMLTQVRSRDSGTGTSLSGTEEMKRKWTGGSARRRTGSGGSLTIPASALFPERQVEREAVPPIQSPVVPLAAENNRIMVVDAGPAVDAPNDGTDLAIVNGGARVGVNGPSEDEHEQSGTVPRPTSLHTGDKVFNNSNSTKLNQLPYRPLAHPLPAESHCLYPNFTPAPPIPIVDHVAAGAESIEAGNSTPPHPHDAHPESRLIDRRSHHAEVEDDYNGYIFSRDQHPSTDETQCEVQPTEHHVEWDPSVGRRRWVGPMILVAQLHPSDRLTAHPPHVSLSAPTEGEAPDLGAKGTYVSLGFEDFDALFPWVKLQGGGAYEGGEAKRGGMGFAVPGG